MPSIGAGRGQRFVGAGGQHRETDFFAERIDEGLGLKTAAAQFGEVGARDHENAGPRCRRGHRTPTASSNRPPSARVVSRMSYGRDTAAWPADAVSVPASCAAINAVRAEAIAAGSVGLTGA